MVYHIFGSTKGPSFKCKLKQDLATNPENYDQCLEDYNRIITDSKYTDIYFICDFGIYKPRLFEYVSENDNILQLPFMVISEWHFDRDLYSGDRNNDSWLELKGFKESFKNNRIALEKFLYYVESKIQAEFYYGSVELKSPICIADTRSIIVNKNHNVIRKFKF